LATTKKYWYTIHVRQAQNRVSSNEQVYLISVVPNIIPQIFHPLVSLPTEMSDNGLTSLLSQLGL
jgi:hypothetical protein